MMRILCTIHISKYFDFFDDLNNTFGDDWEFFWPDKSIKPNQRCDIMASGNSVWWNDQLSKKKNDLQFDLKKYNFGTRVLYAYVECQDNLLFKLKWC